MQLASTTVQPSKELDSYAQKLRCTVTVRVACRSLGWIQDFPKGGGGGGGANNSKGEPPPGQSGEAFAINVCS